MAARLAARYPEWVEHYRWAERMGLLREPGRLVRAPDWRVRAIEDDLPAPPEVKQWFFKPQDGRAYVSGNYTDTILY